MKEIFKQSFSWESLKPFVIGVSTILILEFLVFPGLTLANTFINILSGLVLIGLIIFTVTYLRDVFKPTPKMSAKPKEGSDIENQETTE
jgi:hypothetical protein